ncbi:MAG TPA: alpha/beta hydrolase [Candidatus Dormibacteraeota bacterium]|jgi:pimeloyl-ACP methyl ester carboxylesterase
MSTIASITSKDGTTIGYRQLGHGPGVVLVQGTMGSAQNFMELAGALADSFTVYVPDRRGRGLSSLPYSPDYRIQNDVDDLEALLRQTGAQDVFGLSSGAIIALQAARTLTGIRKLAIFEPPLFIDGAPIALVRRYEREMADGKVAAALITAMKAAQMGPAIFNVIPGWLLEPLTNMAMSQEEKKGTGDYIPMRQLAPTLQYDFQVVLEISGHVDDFRSVNADVLLLGGSKSPAYLKSGLDTLEKVLPHATRVEFPGLGHAASWNKDRGGQPEQVAAELRKFFS